MITLLSLTLVTLLLLTLITLLLLTIHTVTAHPDHTHVITLLLLTLIALLLLTLITLLLLTSHTVTAHPVIKLPNAHLDHSVTAHLVDHAVSVIALERQSRCVSPSVSVSTAAGRCQPAPRGEQPPHAVSRVAAECVRAAGLSG